MDHEQKSNRHINQTAKDMLGRLLASEDINIVHDPRAKTATFHTETRTLTLPDWSYMSSDVYDLLVGHEVGHALYTPNLGEAGMKKLLATISKNPTLAMTYLNIAEDVRIEKKIQNKFPGLRRNFTNGYVQMVKEDFFQTAGKDLSQLRFADRVNLHAKAGSSMGIQFNAEETRVLRQVENAVSFDDTVEAAKAMLALAREQNKDNQSDAGDDSTESVPCPDGEQPDGFDDSEAGETNRPASTDPSLEEEENQGGNSSTDSDDDSSDEPQDTGCAGDDSDGEGEEETDKGGSMEDDTDDGSSAESSTGDDTTDGNQTGHDGGDPESSSDDSALMPQTQDAFDDSMSDSMNSNPGDPIEYVTCPDTDLSQVVVDHKLMARIMSRHYDALQTDTNPYDHAAKLVKAFDRSTTKVVNLMVKRFEMKKAADSHKRTMTGKTGLLNVAKLHEYRFSEDLFLRAETTHDGKNHGLVLFIDWSGSMCNCLSNTIKQLMTLTTFCRKVGIPFEVYAFSDRFAGCTAIPSGWKEENPVLRSDTTPNPNLVPGNMRVSQKLRLMNLLSSRMKGTENKKAMQHLMLIADYYENYYCSENRYGVTTFVDPRSMNLGCTPLDDAIVVANTILPKFRKDHKLQVVNVCFLTDGSSGTGPLDRIFDGTVLGKPGGWYTSERILRSARTKRQFSKSHYDNTVMATTSALLAHLGDNTGANVIGYALAQTRRDINYMMGWDDAKKLWKSVCKDGAVVSGMEGYDEHYILDSRINTTEEDDSLSKVDIGATKKALAKSFTKSRKTHTGSKIVAQKFVDLVCKEN